jgi:hypothetical protein
LHFRSLPSTVAIAAGNGRSSDRITFQFIHSPVDALSVVCGRRQSVRPRRVGTRDPFPSRVLKTRVGGDIGAGEERDISSRSETRQAFGVTATIGFSHPTSHPWRALGNVDHSKPPVRQRSLRPSIGRATIAGLTTPTNWDSEP